MCMCAGSPSPSTEDAVVCGIIWTGIRDVLAVRIGRECAELIARNANEMFW